MSLIWFPKLHWLVNDLTFWLNVAWSDNLFLACIQFRSSPVAEALSQPFAIGIWRCFPVAKINLLILLPTQGTEIATWCWRISITYLEREIYFWLAKAINLYLSVYGAPQCPFYTLTIQEAVPKAGIRPPCVRLCCLNGWWPFWVVCPTNYTKLTPPDAPTIVLAVVFRSHLCIAALCPLVSCFLSLLSCPVPCVLSKVIAMTWSLRYIMIFFSLSSVQSFFLFTTTPTGIPTGYTLS